MKIEIGKTYMTRNGRFVKVVDKPWPNLEIYNTEAEEDGRGDTLYRHTENGIAEDYYYGGRKVVEPPMDIIMEDGPEARQLAEQMKIDRKLGSYNNTK